jgi:hypothetical protein
MTFHSNRPRWSQIAVSLLVVTLGLAGAHTLNRIDQDLRIMYTEYTLAATDLAHVLADIMRYRNVIIRAMETPTKREFDRITAALPQLRIRIEGIIERFAAASMKLRDRHNEPPELQAARDSLDDYFAASEQTLALLNRIWAARSPAEAADLRSKAERNVAEHAGTKLVQVTLAIDALLDSVAKVGRELREEGSGLIRGTSMALLVGSFILACANLLAGASSSSPSESGTAMPLRDERAGEGKPSVPAYYSVGPRGSDSDRLS